MVRTLCIYWTKYTDNGLFTTSCYTQTHHSNVTPMQKGKNNILKQRCAFSLMFFQQFDKHFNLYRLRMLTPPPNGHVNYILETILKRVNGITYL